MSFAYYTLGLLKYIFHVFKVPNNSLILLYGCIILNLPLMFQSWANQTNQLKDTGSFWSTEMLEEGQLASVSSLTHKTLHKAPEMLFLLQQFCTECIPHFTSCSEVHLNSLEVVTLHKQVQTSLHERVVQQQTPWGKKETSPFIFE